MSTTPTPNEKMAALLGGTNVTVTYLDGTTEAVRVRALPVRLLPDYLRNYDKEPETIELFCTKPEGWADTLTPDSFLAVLDAGQKLNDTSFFAWLGRHINRMEKVAPGTTGELGKILLSRSQTSLPSAPSAPA